MTFIVVFSLILWKLAGNNNCSYIHILQNIFLYVQQKKIFKLDLKQLKGNKMTIFILNTAVNPETSTCVSLVAWKMKLLKWKISYLHHLYWSIALWSYYVFRWGGRLEESFFWCPEQTDGWAFPSQTSWNTSRSQTEVWPLLPINVTARREPVYYTGFTAIHTGCSINFMHSIAYNNLTVIKPHSVYMLTFIKKRWSQHMLQMFSTGRCNSSIP